MRLTMTQERALCAIHRVESYAGVANDLEGDLSVTSGNWPATAAGLERRGLIVCDWDHHAAEGEEWTCTLTPEGEDAVADLLDSNAVTASRLAEIAESLAVSEHQALVILAEGMVTDTHDVVTIELAKGMLEFERDRSAEPKRNATLAPRQEGSSVEAAARAAALALGFCSADEWDSGDCDGYDRDRAYIVALAVLEAAALSETPAPESAQERT